jgi:hypothetical protein
MEYTGTEQWRLSSKDQEDTVAILQKRIPPDFKYKYYRDMEYFDVVSLVVNKIANLQKLCNLLAWNIVRINKLDCVRNLICHIFSISHTQFFSFQMKV